MKLGLGSAQFGLDYGISNTLGKTQVQEVDRILELAQAEQLQLIDTASAYGDSETVLGTALSQPAPAHKAHNFRIVTKTPCFNDSELNSQHGEKVLQCFKQSLRNLQRDKLYGLLVHHAEDLLKPGAETLFLALQTIKKEELVDKIGVSVSTPKEALELKRRYPLDLIQLPLNIFDQRFLQDGLLNQLKQDGTEIHIRSIFLQGLLLLNPAQLPSYFGPIEKHFIHYQQTLKKLALSPLQGCLSFIHRIHKIDHFICGINSAPQLEEITNTINTIKRTNSCDSTSIEQFQQCAITDPRFINPGFWQ